MLAAITAAEQGKKVMVIEKKNTPGKKLLATGNGRCNYTNLLQKPECYRCEETGFVDRVLSQFDVDDTLAWFRERGVLPRDRDGYVYPLSGQASAVRNALERAMRRAGVTVCCEETVRDIVPKYTLHGQSITGYEVHTDRQKLLAGSVILAMGGAAAPAQGTTGDAYPILEKLGVKLRKPLPALTSVELSEDCCRQWAGVRIYGQISLWLAGQLLGQDTGEIQMVASGISGIPVFQLSGLAARQLAKGNRPELHLDCLPDFTEERLRAELLHRLESFGDESTLGDLLDGMLPDKLAGALLGELHLKKSQSAAIVKQEETGRALIGQIKNKRLEISRVSGFEKAQVTSGGVDVSELDASTMELKRYPHLYITGELADVDGICGGYNLQWAWSSGYLAGTGACREKQ